MSLHTVQGLHLEPGLLVSCTGLTGAWARQETTHTGPSADGESSCSEASATHIVISSASCSRLNGFASMLQPACVLHGMASRLTLWQYA
jgi:hypothetical protein